MASDVVAGYEALPYEGNAYTHSHPDALATLAFLMGMTPAPVERCRVLELGCAQGANLVPMAAALPESHFMGLDLSPRQIAFARTLAADLGLKNLTLHSRSILDIDPSLGQFDYIICHGVYSWVEPEVQEKILAICKHNLAPQGLAYVSYNCFPGWHMRYVARDLMLFHTRGIKATADKVQKARRFLNAFVELFPEPDCTYHRLLKDQAALMADASDWYVCHEQLEPTNLACYFHEFMERARRHGLQFVGETGFQTTEAAWPAGLREKIEDRLGDRLDQEQYFDFLTSRTFRQTVLCHGDLPLAPRPLAQRLMRCGLIAGAAPKVEHASAVSNEGIEFHSQGQTTITNEPIVKAALLSLHEARPRWLPFDELWQKAAGQLPEPPPAVMRPAFAMLLLQCWLWNLVQVQLRPAPLCLAIGERPIAFPVARWQARNGAQMVTSIRHHMIQLDEINAQLLPLLDGTRDREQLQRDLGQPADLEQRLQALARSGLITG